MTTETIWQLYPMPAREGQSQGTVSAARIAPDH